MFGISYLKIGTVVAGVAVIGFGYLHYTSLVRQVTGLKVQLSEKEKELRSAKAAVEAINEVMRSTEIEQEKSRTLRNSVSAARPTSDVELPKPLADAFLKRFGEAR